METGLLFMTKRVNNICIKSVENTDLKKTQLSIQINLDGFSFCVQSLPEKHLIVFQSFEFEHRTPTPEAHLTEIEKIYAENEFLGQDYKKVEVIHQNELATVVPDELFEEHKLKDYLDHTVKVLPIDFISFDKTANTNTVYIPFVNINNFLFNIYGSFEYFHSFTKLIEITSKEDITEVSDKIFIQVNHKNFELLAYKHNQLQVVNKFEFQTAEDFIYYILFTAEQLKLNPEVFHLILMGDIEKESELYSILYTYIRHITFFKVKALQNREAFQSLPKHANCILFN